MKKQKISMNLTKKEKKINLMSQIAFLKIMN
jgi:hypothetical protein